MKFKKFKKGEVTLTNVFVTTIIGILIFGAFLAFVNQSALESGVTVDSRYNDSYNRMLNAQSNLSATTNEIRDSMQDLTEAEDAASTAYFGLKGALALFKLPLQIINPVLETSSTVMDMLDFVPNSIIVTATIIFTLLIVFALLRFITQRSNNA